MYVAVSHLASKYSRTQTQTERRAFVRRRRPAGGLDAGADHVTIDPAGRPAPLRPNGGVDLCPGHRADRAVPRGRPQAAMYFSQLNANNVFSGQRNVFQGHLEVRRCYFTSDPRAKEDLHRLDPVRSANLVRSITPYSYTMDGVAASGLLANAVPTEYTHTDPSGTLSVAQPSTDARRRLLAITTRCSRISGRPCRSCRPGPAGTPGLPVCRVDTLEAERRARPNS